MTVDATIDISEARRQLNTLDQRLVDEPIINVRRRNKNVFVVVNHELMSAILESLEIMSDPGSYEAFQQSLRDIREGRLHDHEDIKRELG
jgi:hypothetical protein